MKCGLVPKQTRLLSVFRLVFTTADLCIDSPAYNYFRLQLYDLTSSKTPRDYDVTTKVVAIDFPQVFHYSRSSQLVGKLARYKLEPIFKHYIVLCTETDIYFLLVNKLFWKKCVYFVWKIRYNWNILLVCCSVGLYHFEMPM